MSMEKEQIKDTIDNVQKVVDLFYQQNDKEAFDMFTGVLDDMSAAVQNLASYKEKNIQFEMDEIKIYNILNDAMEALQSDDKVLMADILQYDFIDYINELLEHMV